MCGFAGFIESSTLTGADPRSVLDAMVASIEHRGPDDHGTWVDEDAGVHLGFRRLSIQDLSPMGHQPMVSASQRWIVTFNGEIYNFGELREELRKSGTTFRGGSDTEVLLAAVERWGVRETLPRLRGMFAFALWDRKERELWLARDRMGIKPLYIAAHPTGVVFGSELRALLLHPRVERRGDPRAARQFLRTLYVPAPMAIIEGVEKLRPGHVARFALTGGGGMDRSEEAWWDLDRVAHVDKRTDLSGAEAVDELHALLRDSVRLRLVADVPVGALLSGGVDSSLVVALMAEQSPTPVRTFTVRFDDPRFDEGPIAREVASILGAEHTEVELPTDVVRDLVPSLPDFSDEPMGNPSILPTLLVSQVARRDVTVALSGDGGDELFGGYNRYLRAPSLVRAVGRIPSGLAGTVAAALRGTSRLPGLDGLGKLGAAAGLGGQHRLTDRLARLAGAVDEEGAAGVYEGLMAVGLTDPPLREGLETEGLASPRHDADRESLLAFMMREDQARYLPDDLLAKVDRASMWTALEVRVPILDHRVVEWSWGLPDDLKIHEGKPKWCLRSVAERYVPAEVLDRPKMGFTVPVEGWLRGDLSAWLGEAVDERRTSERGLLEPAAVAAVHRDFRKGRPGHALGLWALAVLEHWCEAHGVHFG
ncbi:MAG: asparagine synthase (glutamine-hydrolyzing) [Gemmatimonadetes bacterium]|nr:asparagine synthase (glutamine-hydrolyzing) [Gemmatimonadota bacterium]